METLALYLLKSATWLTGFALVYYLFMRNERFFRLNRFFLLSGIMASFFLPLLTIHYFVELPAVSGVSATTPEIGGVVANPDATRITFGFILSALYIAGVLLVAAITLIRGRTVLKSIKKSEIISSDHIKLVRTDEFPGSFSFFSYVVVNPSVSDVETQEIVNHELGHIRQKHWVDLVLTEMLCTMQWFNPVSWIFARFVRQNHEYLADAEALQRSSDPAIYRATLLNQIVGTPVFTMVNSFNYSLNKKRFKMMKNIINSPYRKMKALLILPVIAVILYAFARPEYRLPEGSSVQSLKDQGKEVNGIVVQQSGTPLEGAIVIIKGTTVGTVADAKGSFKLTGVADDGSLVVSFIGYKSKVIKPVFGTDMIIKMVRDTLSVHGELMPPPPPPPPPPISKFEKPPLLVIDGKVSSVDLKSIDEANIESINVLKDEVAVTKYGDKGKNGVLEITMKKGNSTGSVMKNSNENVEKVPFVVVEGLPEFPGGSEGLSKYLISNMKYPPDAKKNGITGGVTVTFMVNNSGKISDVQVVQPVNPLLDAEAVRLVSSMPDWKPGSQAGKNVPVMMKLLIVFKLK